MVHLTLCRSGAPRDYSTLRQNELDAVVADLLSVAHDHASERRQTERSPFTRPVELMPCDPTGNRLEEPIFCVGKEISTQGFGFFHRQPLPHRYLVLSFAPSLDSFSHRILMRMKRCRFLSEHWYESGAQFLRVLPVTDPGPHFDDFDVLNQLLDEENCS